MGRDEEFTEYVGARWPRLVRTVVLLGCPRGEAEAVVRAALVRCLTDWSRVRRADDREAYVHRVVVETFRTEARRWPEGAADAAPADPVLHRLRRLPEDQRLAVVLRDYAGLDERQAATATGTSVGRVHATVRLERAADEVVVLAPPVAPMLAEADRLRRHRRLTIGGVVLAVLATLGLADTVSAVVDPSPEAWPATGPPDGTRFVGLGRAVIAVPTGWATDAVRCGQPVRDTVVLAPAGEACRGSRPADVRSVAVSSGPPGEGFTAETTYDVEGRQVQRGRTTCSAGTCSAVVHVPTDDATFTVSSSTARPERARAEVTAMVRGVRVLEGMVAVPTTGALAADYGRSARTKYVADLRGLGLTPVVRAEHGTGDAGTVTGVSPSPGTPLRRGSDVVVTVAAGPRTPRDEVAVGLGSVDDDRNYRGLTHEDFRRGATLEVPQGTDLWAFADGRRSGTLAARQKGASIAIDFWRNGPNWPTAWEAVLPGTTDLTLSIRVDGERVDLGTVRIVVAE